MRVTPFADRQSRFIAGKFGMRLFLASLGMLFGAGLVGFIVIRIQLAEKESWPADLPPLPRAMWLSTLVLILSSWTMQSALKAVRTDRLEQLRSFITITTMLGLGFLMIQIACWMTWLQPVWQRWGLSSEYRYALTSFYILTGLHALHVIGGLIPMCIVTRQAFQDAYFSQSYAGVQYCAMYWHFLDAVWIVLFAALMIGS